MLGEALLAPRRPRVPDEQPGPHPPCACGHFASNPYQPADLVEQLHMVSYDDLFDELTTNRTTETDEGGTAAGSG